jgi:transposase
LFASHHTRVRQRVRLHDAQLIQRAIDL